MTNTNLLAYCEYTCNPLGVNSKTPRFSWKLTNYPGMQTNYRVRVAQSAEALNNDDLLWDTKIAAGSETKCRYAGPELESARLYYFDIQIWCGDNSFKSDTYYFLTALYNQEDWQGRFIGFKDYKKRENYMLVKKFRIRKNLEHAYAYICGPGYSELYLNSCKIGDNVLEPGWTDYNRRVLYSVYDVTQNIKKGANLISVMLGEGWLGHEHKFFMQTFGTNPSWLGNPCLLMNLKLFYSDGTSETIYTDEGLKWYAAKGPVIMNNIYDGETYDARLEITLPEAEDFRAEAPFSPAIAVEGPKGELYRDLLPPIKRFEKLRARTVYRPTADSMTIDFGKNIAGWVKLRVRGEAGSKIVVKFAETINSDFSVNQENLRTARATDEYILKGEGIEEYEPRFTYHGFRYVQIFVQSNSSLLNATAYRVNSSVNRTGWFSCDNQMLNDIYDTIVSTERNNLHSVPTDCPQRDERLAWINDMTVRFEEAMYNYDMLLFYEKWLRDIKDAQDGGQNGEIGDTAPYFYGGRPAYHISSVYVLLPYFIYLFYNDDTALKEHYDGMKKYTDFMLTQLDERGLVSSMYVGEWAPPLSESAFSTTWDALPANIDNQLVTTCYLYYCLTIMQKSAEYLGLNSQSQFYGDKAYLLKDSIISTFFDRKGYFVPFSQGSNVFPMFLGIIPSGADYLIANMLIENIVEENEYHVTTGSQLTKYLFEVLNLMKRNDIGVQILSRTDYPSIGYMLANGATSLWERWENTTGDTMNSHNHPMQGAFCPWFFKALAGIIPYTLPYKGYITISPDFTTALNKVQACVELANGKVSSQWERRDGTVTFNLSLPFNTKARVIVPLLGLEPSQLSMNGSSYTGKAVNGTAEYMLEAGEYTFKLG